MAQQWDKPWVVRVVGPRNEIQYFLVGSSAASAAKDRVQNILNGSGRKDWQVDEPVEPRQI